MCECVQCDYSDLSGIWLCSSQTTPPDKNLLKVLVLFFWSLCFSSKVSVDLSTLLLTLSLLHFFVSNSFNLCTSLDICSRLLISFSLSFSPLPVSHPFHQSALSVLFPPCPDQFPGVHCNVKRLRLWAKHSFLSTSHRVLRWDKHNYRQMRLLWELQCVYVWVEQMIS